jgi:lysophospholipase L1-like esterase
MKRVLIYGDSNTYGTAPMAKLGPSGAHPAGTRWGDVMAVALGPDWQIITEGLPGRTSVHDDPIEGAHLNGRTVLPAILHSHAPIDLLIICLGANDHKARFGLAAQDIAMGVATLVRDARSSGAVCQTLALCPPPIKERGDFAKVLAGAEARGAGLAGEMERFCTAEGAAFFDAGEVISVDPVDGIHWDIAAHQALGEAMEAPVRSLCRESGATSPPSA